MAKISFEPADPRSRGTLEREKFVELGAIVLAGLCLMYFERRRITRVTRRGNKVDYFVGELPGDTSHIMEVGGTDHRSFTTLRAEKHAQLRKSPYRLPPHVKDGFVAVTRFAPEAASGVDFVSAAEE